MFSLSFTYIESCKVGKIVARIRELNQICEFITKKSVSVLLDTLFSIVFLGMRLLYSSPLTLMVIGSIAVKDSHV
ncbi:MAG: hypothetical protein AB7P76_07220 [Candidatus Melainabacteria bacterium]